LLKGWSKYNFINLGECINEKLSIYVAIKKLKQNYKLNFNGQIKNINIINR